MTSIQLPHMYGLSAVQFTDPLASRHNFHEGERATWSSHSHHQDFNRALTPPPDMNSVAHSTKPGYYQKEHANHYGEHKHAQPAYRAPIAHHLAQDVYGNGGRSGISSQPRSRTLSPATGPQQPVFNDPQSRKGSHVNAIAPSFQIPRSVNDSGGSLSELAAQITCLFWFESADILQQVEESTLPLPLARSLVTDAKPTTGFRKWVTTILSTTMVAQNVVLLALLFIYRLKKLNPTVRGKPGSEYRLLTVALMLGNKFLDDNTYTNKTWAEVSGIVVGEVHIMEVEFLSNMKYCLFTSAEDWSSWQTLLGRFAAFVDRASQPQRPAPILPPASSLNLPMALPSPPVSNQASPPYAMEIPYSGPSLYTFGQHGPTPAPSPLKLVPDHTASRPNTRKRSFSDHSVEPAPKRIASSHGYTSPTHHSIGAAQQSIHKPVPRLTLPSLPIPVSSAVASSSQHPQHNQLPPLGVPPRSMAMIYPPSGTQLPAPQLPPPTGISSQPSSQLPSHYHSRQQSPYAGSGAVSPSSAASQTSTSLHPPAQVSPTYFLQQRNSPYRPVHNVSTLLYPPPSAALHQRPQSVEYSQMHYQPLGKPFQQRQSGRLPYVSQNVWLDGNHGQAMTPVHQWPGFSQSHHQPPVSQQ